MFSKTKFVIALTVLLLPFFVFAGTAYAAEDEDLGDLVVPTSPTDSGADTPLGPDVVVPTGDGNLPSASGPSGDGGINAVPVGDVNIDATTDFTCGTDEEGEPIYISVDVECTGGADNPILSYIGGLANFMSVGVGIVLTIGTLILGFQYMTSKGEPQTIKKAHDRALNLVLAGITYYFIFALLKWIIPTGF